jgi:hypothetical protein
MDHFPSGAPTARLSDWRGVLHRQPTQARPILKKLLAGPLQFKPEKGRYYSFEGEISFAKIFSDLGIPFSVASPRSTAYVRCTLETTRGHRRRGAGASGVNGGQ